MVHAAYLEALEQAGLVGFVPDGWRTLEQAVAVRNVLVMENNVVRGSFHGEGQACTSSSSSFSRLRKQCQTDWARVEVTLYRSACKS